MNGGGRSQPVRELRRKNEKHFPSGEHKHGYFHQGQRWSFVIVGNIDVIVRILVFVFDVVTLSPRSWLIGGSKPVIATKQLPARGLNNRRSDSLSHQACLLVQEGKLSLFQLNNRDSQILFCLFCPQGGLPPNCQSCRKFCFQRRKG